MCLGQLSTKGEPDGKENQWIGRQGKRTHSNTVYDHEAAGGRVVACRSDSGCIGPASDQPERSDGVGAVFERLPVTLRSEFAQPSADEFPYRKHSPCKNAGKPNADNGIASKNCVDQCRAGKHCADEYRAGKQSAEQKSVGEQSLELASTTDSTTDSTTERLPESADDRCDVFLHRVFDSWPNVFHDARGKIVSPFGSVGG